MKKDSEKMLGLHIKNMYICEDFQGKNLIGC